MNLNSPDFFKNRADPFKITENLIRIFIIVVVIGVLIGISALVYGVCYLGKRVSDEGLKGVAEKIWYGTNVNEKGGGFIE